MDYAKAYTFIRDDEGWLGKLAIGAALALFSWLLLPAIVLFGYQVGVTRNVMRGEKQPLPAWGDDIGRLFKDGLIIWVGQLVYALPIVLISVCFAVLSVPAALAEGDAQVALEGLGTAGTIVLSCVIVLFAIALVFLIPAVFIQYARTDDIASLFRVREVAGIARDNLVDILMTTVASIVAGIILSIVITISIITICGPIILPFVGSFWLTMASGHLYGQIGAKLNGKAAGMALA